VVRGTTIYVPVTVDARVMASVMRTHGFDDVDPRFVAGQEVLPYLAPHEARRLFGGADQGVHSHVTDHQDSADPLDDNGEDDRGAAPRTGSPP
jgi:urease accessory protein